MFENAAGLGRDELIADEEPLWGVDVSVTYQPINPGERYSSTTAWWQHDDLGNQVAPGTYTLVGLDGPYPWAWEGATVDYSDAYVTVTIVPEPGTLCMLAGIAAAGLVRRRRTT